MEIKIVNEERKREREKRCCALTKAARKIHTAAEILLVDGAK